MNTCKAMETIPYLNRYCIGLYEEKEEDVHKKTGNRVLEELWEKAFKWRRNGMTEDNAGYGNCIV